MSDRIVNELAGLISSGELGEGARLPAERDLALRFGVSRVNLREGLRALQELGLVTTRRGSGASIRPRRDWSLAALPGLLRARTGEPRPAAALRPWVIEALALRRTFARSLPSQLAGRLATGALSAARRRASEAWAAREAAPAFVELDASALRAAPEAAGAPACGWLLNDLTRVAVSLAAWLPGALPYPADYLARQDELWDALESGDAARAERLVGTHLSRLDRGLLAAFDDGGAGGP
jgi:GntR family transcriptional regulator, transcriptional repressor for pyruvate dehydrogenase complex